MQTLTNFFFPMLMGLILLIPFMRFGTTAVSPYISWRVELAAVLILFFIGSYYRKDLFSLRTQSLTLRLFACLSLFFIGLSIFSTTWADSPDRALHFAVQLSVYAFVTFLTFKLINERGSFARISAIFLTSFGLLAITGSAQFTLLDLGASFYDIRLSYGKYAEMALPALPVLLALTLHSRSNNAKGLHLTAYFAGLIVVLLSTSKGSFLAGFVSLSLFGAASFIFRPDRRKQILVFGVATAFIFFAFQIYSKQVTNTPTAVEYISGSADKDRSTSNFRIDVWKVGADIFKHNLILGVGAGNFGLSVEAAQERLHHDNQTNLSKDFGEYYIVERAHNELLQIAAELGIAGLSVVALMLLLFCKLTIQALGQRKNRRSFVFWGSLSGIIGFGLSSMVSSFSLRVPQNSIVFALVFGLFLHQTLKSRRNIKAESVHLINPQWRSRFAFSILLLCAIFSAREGAANVLLRVAESDFGSDTAGNYLQTALRISPANESANYSYALWLESRHESALAVPYFKKAVENGVQSGISHSVFADILASAEGNEVAAVYLATITQKYPRSVFLRTRYAYYLERSGNVDLAEVVYAESSKIDSSQTKGWRLFLKDPLTAAELSKIDSSIAHPSKLFPEQAAVMYMKRNDLEEALYKQSK